MRTLFIPKWLTGYSYYRDFQFELSGFRPGIGSRKGSRRSGYLLYRQQLISDQKMAENESIEQPAGTVESFRKADFKAEQIIKRHYPDIGTEDLLALNKVLGPAETYEFRIILK
jgi:hypothetical protein